MNLTTNLLTPQRYSRSGRKLLELRALVMHWTATPGQEPEEVRHYYESDEAQVGKYGSSHYIVGTDGAVLQVIPEDEVAFHVGSEVLDPASKRLYTDFARTIFPEVADPVSWSPNPFTLGVEMCVLDWDGTFAQATLEAARELTLSVLAAHPGIVVTTHNAIVGWKDCPRWWVTHPEDFVRWRTSLVPAPVGNPHEVAGGANR